MINTKIMTTKQKKFIEKILKILDISLDDFLRLQNLKDYYDLTDKQIKDLENEIELEKSKNEKMELLFKEQQKQIDTLVESYNKIVVKLNENEYRSMFGDLYDSREGDRQ